MKFKLISKYFRYSSDELYDLLKDFCIQEDGVLYLDIKYISELKPILNAIPEECYSDRLGWKPDSVIIDFRDNSICLYDSYAE